MHRVPQPAHRARLPLVLLCAAVLAGCATTGDDVTAAGGNPREAARLNARLGVDYMRQGDDASARAKLERAVQQDPKLADAHAALGLLYGRSGEYEKAERHYRRASELEPDNAGLLNNYGVFLCGRGQHARAEGLFRRAAQNPRYATPEAAYTNAGVCARKIPDLVKAEGYFREALARNPNFGDALGQMALLNADRGNYLGARAFLQRYETVAPMTRETLLLAVRIELALGDRAAANRYNERLKTEFPASAGNPAP